MTHSSKTGSCYDSHSSEVSGFTGDLAAVHVKAADGNNVPLLHYPRHCVGRLWGETVANGTVICAVLTDGLM